MTATQTIKAWFSPGPYSRWMKATEKEYMQWLRQEQKGEWILLWLMVMAAIVVLVGMAYRYFTGTLEDGDSGPFIAGLFGFIAIWMESMLRGAYAHHLLVMERLEKMGR